MKKTVLLGIQPTGRLHVGHYIGVLSPALKQKNLSILIAQYHSLTSQSKETENERIYYLYNELRKMGFKSITLQESGVLKLFFELLAQEPMGRLERLPQYRTKEKTAGMLLYPLLMAADIIHSGATHVLVGEDQIPHMDYYKTVATKHKYPVAKTIVVPDSRIMSIKDPSKKMSKSLGDEHCLYLDDTLETLHKKLSKAPTTKDGIDNLKRIAAGFGIEFDEKQAADSKKILATLIFAKLNKK